MLHCIWLELNILTATCTSITDMRKLSQKGDQMEINDIAFNMNSNLLDRVQNELLKMHGLTIYSTITNILANNEGFTQNLTHIFNGEW